MTYLRIAVKSAIFLFLAATYLLVSLFWRLWTRDLVRRRYLATHTVSFFCRLALKVMRFRIHVVNPPDPRKSFLLIGNHLGILDILVLSSIHPTLFITSIEMRQTPGLGLMTEMGGCLYVERRSRAGILNEIEDIRQALKQGFSVALYPEGTSSNGERVLPFKKSLVVAAAGTGIPIKPVVTNYRKVNGEPMSHKWRDCVCWYGDQTFLPAVVRIFSVKSIDVEVEFCAEIEVHSEEERREITQQVQSIIVSKYAKIPLPDGVSSPFAHLPEAN